MGDGGQLGAMVGLDHFVVVPPEKGIGKIAVFFLQVLEWAVFSCLCGGIADSINTFIAFMFGEEGKDYRLKNRDVAEELFSIPALSRFQYPLSGLVNREEAFKVLERYVQDGRTGEGTPACGVHGELGAGKSKLLQRIGERKEIPESLANLLDGYLPLAITWKSFSPDSSQNFHYDVAVRLLYS